MAVETERVTESRGETTESNAPLRYGSMLVGLVAFRDLRNGMFRDLRNGTGS